MTTRNSAGQFVKGQSGNPSGKAKTPSIIIDANGQSLPLDQLLELNGDIVIARLLKIIADNKTPASAAVTAIRTYMEYWIGKPTAKLIIKPSQDNNETVYTIENLSQDDLKRLYDSAKPKGDN